MGCCQQKNEIQLLICRYFHYSLFLASPRMCTELQSFYFFNAVIPVIHLLTPPVVYALLIVTILLQWTLMMAVL